MQILTKAHTFAPRKCFVFASHLLRLYFGAKVRTFQESCKFLSRNLQEKTKFYFCYKNEKYTIPSRSHFTRNSRPNRTIN